MNQCVSPEENAIHKARRTSTHKTKTKIIIIIIGNKRRSTSRRGAGDDVETPHAMVANDARGMTCLTAQRMSVNSNNIMQHCQHAPRESSSPISYIYAANTEDVGEKRSTKKI